MMHLGGVMFSDVEIRWKRGNRLLFSHNSPCLQGLIELMRKQNHRVLVMWALDCVKETLARFEARYPDETRPRRCLELCASWSRDEVKMPLAKRAILDAHRVAKEISNPQYGAICHAIGHAGATVHVASHAIGLPIYELTAIVLEYALNDFSDPVRQKIDFYIQKLKYWQAHTDHEDLKWAKFLLNSPLG